MDADGGDERELGERVEALDVDKLVLQNEAQSALVDQSVDFGIRMTGRRTPNVSGDETRSDWRMTSLRRRGCAASQRRA